MVAASSVDFMDEPLDVCKRSEANAPGAEANWPLVMGEGPFGYLNLESRFLDLNLPSLV
jgi:hypothetical protein